MHFSGEFHLEYHGNCNQPLLGALGAAGRTQIFQVDDETMQLLRDQKILFEREVAVKTINTGQLIDLIFISIIIIILFYFSFGSY